MSIFINLSALGTSLGGGGSFAGGLFAVGLFATKGFVAELLRDGLEFPNAILQEGLRYIEDGLCKFS